MKKLVAALMLALVLMILIGCEAPEVIPRHEDRPGHAEHAERLPKHDADRLSVLVSRASRPDVDPDVAALIEEADAMRDALEVRQPPVATAMKIARMYESGGRYPDAIDWYRRVIEAARPALEAFDELRDAGVDEEVANAPNSCRPSGSAGSFEAASARARALEEEERPLALACYRAALAPIAEAKRRRGESWLALDSPFRALRHLERALVITPDEPELLLLLGVISFEIEPSRLGRDRALGAKEAWGRYLALAPDGPMARQVREALPHVELLIEHGQFEKPRH